MKFKSILIISLGLIFWIQNPAHADDDIEKAMNKVLSIQRDDDGVSNPAIEGSDILSRRKVMVSPDDTIYKVISVAFYNIGAGVLQTSERLKLLEASVSEKGPVAEYLRAQGFNFHVFMRIRRCLGYDPDRVGYGMTVDLSELERSSLGQMLAGIPEFSRDTTSMGAVNSLGQILVEYSPRTSLIIEGIKYNIDLAVRESIRTDQSLLRNGFWFVNRYKQLNTIVQFGLDIEKTLSQLQALEATFKIKSELHKQDEEAVKKLDQLRADWLAKAEDFFKWLETVARATPPNAERESAWEPMYKAIKDSKYSVKEWVNRIQSSNLRAINHIDVILGATKSEEKYAGDTAAELEIKRREHIETQKKFVSIWEKNKNFYYYLRTHTWPYNLYYSNSATGDGTFQRLIETRERDVNGVDLATVPELEIAAQLVQEGERLLERQQEKPAILETRSRLIELKNQLQSVRAAVVLPRVASGEELPQNLVVGFGERADERIQILRDWINFLIDDSSRQEAHEAAGYLGLNLDKEVDNRYVEVLAKVDALGKRLRNIATGVYTSGGVALTSTACWLLLR